MTDKFWMCYAEHGQLPTVVHTTQAAAQLEAARIVGANRDKDRAVYVFVLEAILVVHPPERPLVWENLT